MSVCSLPFISPSCFLDLLIAFLYFILLLDILNISFPLQSDNLVLVSHCTAIIAVNVFVCKILGKYNQTGEGSLFSERQT